jgi:putative nucleotidyltransferase with HDIG domain
MGLCDLAHADSPSDLFRLADGALYWSKVHGRDAACLYDPGIVRELSAQERADALERSQARTGLRGLARAIDAKDPSTRRHSDRVAALCERLAAELGWSSERVALLHEAALVHDVGKIGVPDAVLLKPGRLTPEEYEAVKQHAALGAEIVGEILTPEQVGWVRHHHERPDGRGYPDGLSGDEIADGARIIALADAFDVMTAARPYSYAKPVADAVSEVCHLAGTQFDPEVCSVLAALFARGELRQAASGSGSTPR